ncbi:hypothetical protein [Streptomyces sp. NPDC048473]|uniref:hypothetical protein n=1 Tax=unclassified Streptomyces TaxID=2593676 RepID=UPI003721BA8F
MDGQNRLAETSGLRQGLVEGGLGRLHDSRIGHLHPAGHAEHTSSPLAAAGALRVTRLLINLKNRLEGI